MSTSLFTAEEKRRSWSFQLRLQEWEMAEDRLKDKEYGLEYFIPKHYAVRTYHGVKSKKLVPVIPSLLFVHASHLQITEFKKRYNFLQFAMWEKSTGAEYITVPDDQMDSFIKIASHYEEDTVYYRPEEIDLKRGMRVCIHGGKSITWRACLCGCRARETVGWLSYWRVSWPCFRWGAPRSDWSSFLKPLAFTGTSAKITIKINWNHKLEII